MLGAFWCAPALGATGIARGVSPAQLRALEAEGAHDIIVRRVPGLSGAARARLRASADVRLAAGLRLNDAEVDRAPAGHLARALARLNADPSVVYAEPDAPVHATALPNDPYFGSQWALQNTGQALTIGASTYSGRPGDDIGALGAWRRALGAGVTVAVVDTGVELGAPDLAGQTVDGYDFVAGTPNPQDQNGHGTHVSGLIAAAQGNGTGISGVAPAAKIMPLRVLDASGSGSDGAVAAAFDYAGRHGVRVVNASLGSSLPSRAVADAIAAYPETLYVVAAGNDATNNDSTPSYPCDIATANVICVGASDQNDQPASFSNYGAATVNLFAPGVNIVSTWLNDVTSAGCSTLSPCSRYFAADGTSMAAPLVAGTLALILSESPSLTAAQLKGDVLSSVHPVAALSGKSATGGRLDAAAAVIAAAPAPASSTAAPTAGIIAGSPAVSPPPAPVPTTPPVPASQAPRDIPARVSVPAPAPVSMPAPAPAAVAFGWSDVGLRSSVVSECGGRAREHCAPRSAQLSFRLSGPARLTIALSRLVRGRLHKVASVTVTASVDTTAYLLHRRFSGHRLARGRYLLTAWARSGGQSSTRFRANLSVR